jgi:hypothetical protein
VLRHGGDLAIEPYTSYYIASSVLLLMCMIIIITNVLLLCVRIITNDHFSIELELENCQL